MRYRLLNSQNYLLIIYGLIVFFLGATHNFHLLRVGEMNPSFGDLRLITSASDCSNSIGWSIAGPTCDPWGRGFNYPSIWVQIFSALHIGQSLTDIFGILEIIIFVVSIFYWFNHISTSLKRNFNLNELGLVSLILFSPPVLLLLERGNIDILMFAGLTLVFHFIKISKNYLNFLLLAFLGMLKIYPYFGILGILSIPMTPRIKKIGALLLLLSSVTLVKDLRYIVSRSETVWNVVSYGLNILPLGINQKLNLGLTRQICLIIGLLSFIFVLFIASKTLKLQIDGFMEFLASNTDLMITFLVFTPPFIFSYLAGTSFDYRFVLLLPVFLIFITEFKKNSRILISALLIMGIFYGGDKAPLALNITSDVLVELVVAFLSLVVLRILRTQVRHLQL